MSPEEEIATEKEAERELSAQSPAAPTGMAAGFAMFTLTGNAGPLIAQWELLRAALQQVQELAEQAGPTMPEVLEVLDRIAKKSERPSPYELGS